MTEEPFRHDAYLKSCEATVRSAGPEGITVVSPIAAVALTAGIGLAVCNAFAVSMTGLGHSLAQQGVVKSDVRQAGFKLRTHVRPRAAIPDHRYYTPPPVRLYQEAGLQVYYRYCWAVASDGLRRCPRVGAEQDQTNLEGTADLKTGRPFLIV